MTRRGQRAVGQRRVWVRDLALVAFHGYPIAPRDRPRELAEFLSVCSPFLDTFDRAFRRGEPVPHVERWFTAKTAMGDRPFDVVPLDTVSDLRSLLGLSVPDLEWFADVRSLERRSNDERLRHYRYRWSVKRSGGVRLIEEPKALLKHFQRVISRGIICRIPVHEAAHGFRPGHSAVTYAAPHVGRALVIHLDLEDFFPSIAPGRVFGIFRRCGYPEPVAHLLTGLVTNAVPFNVWSKAPRPSSADLLPAFHRLGSYLTHAHLPQGAPSSPALANLVAFTLDRRLSGLADSLGLDYSRYADDLAFSAPAHRSRREVAHLLDLVGTITTEEGFRINEMKTTVRRRGERQRLAGMLVNERLNVDRRHYENLKALLHNAQLNGPESQNRAGHPHFASHVRGRIAWIDHLNPNRGRRLLDSFSQGNWTNP